MEYTKEINKIVEGINFTNKTVKPTKKYKKVCEYCGKEFETNRENKKYCSAACRNSYHVEKYQQKAKVKVEQETEEFKIHSIDIKGTQEFMGKEIPVVEGGFGEGKRCILVREISQIHNMKVGNINQRINDNRKRFKDGVDIIDLKTYTSAVSVLKELGFTQAQIGNANNIYILSERGYAKLIKIMDTDLAWDIYFNLLDEYFAMRQVINHLSQEDKAWLELKHSQQDENAQYLINVTTQKLAIEFNKTLAKEIDGEGKRITLTELADKLSQMAGFKIESINITNFLVYKGYFTKEQFPRRGSFIVNGVVIGRLERNYHRQPTEKFLTEFANKGLSLTKPADERGKIVWEFTNKFEKYFEQTFLEEFIYYVQNTEKGWE